MNREHWISEIAGQSPCGDDLEYDAEFMTLGQLAQGKPEQQYGDTIIPAEEPDWREIERLASALLTRAKDIRICILLIRAYTRNDGLLGLAGGLLALQQLLERYWDQVHPLLVVDGDPDPFMRSNALAGLADLTGLVRDVRQAVLVKSPAGAILVKDAEATLESTQGSEAGYSREQLIAICADAQADGQAGLAAILDADRAFGAIIKLCDERLGGQYAPDLAVLSNLLSKLAKTLAPTEQSTPDSAAPEPAAADTPGAPAKTAHGSAEIRSREDAIRVLETVCRYLEKNEPTNPAPLLIRRAQRLMSLGFLDLIKELAPDGMGQVEIITGVRRDENS